MVKAKARQLEQEATGVEIQTAVAAVPQIREPGDGEPPPPIHVAFHGAEAPCTPGSRFWKLMGNYSHNLYLF